MDLQKLMHQRRTIHSYLKDPIPLETIKTGVELTLWAQNHRMTCPWRYLLLGQEIREDLYKAYLLVHPLTDPEREKKYQALVLNPAWALFLYRALPPEEASPEKKFEIGKEDYASLSMGVQNLSLWLWEQGIGSKWSTGGLSQDLQALSFTQNLLKKDVFARACASEGVLWIGRPAQIPPAPARPGLDKVLEVLS